MAKKYRKKPVVIEAMEFLHTPERLAELSKFIDDQELEIRFMEGAPVLVLQTLEGQSFGKVKDLVIKGIRGEFYPCDPDIFAVTYEPEGN